MTISKQKLVLTLALGFLSVVVPAQAATEQGEKPNAEIVFSGETEQQTVESVTDAAIAEYLQIHVIENALAEQQILTQDELLQKIALLEARMQILEQNQQPKNKKQIPQAKPTTSNRFTLNKRKAALLTAAAVGGSYAVFLAWDCELIPEPLDTWISKIVFGYARWAKPFHLED